MSATGVPPVVEVTLDCADASVLTRFWTLALGYVDNSPDADPARGFAWLKDPRGVGPHLCLLEVPEPKAGKNRMHLDLNVSGAGTPEERWQRVAAEVTRLCGAGASVVTAFPGDHVVLADPEGNEFCLA